MQDVSIVIPVYNEEELIEKEVTTILTLLLEHLPNLNYEIILVENGSTDRTPTLVDNLARSHSTVRAIHLAEADYGRALRTCIVESVGHFIIIFNIDFWDIFFLKDSLQLMTKEGVELVIGSKAMLGAVDNRPLRRRLVTKGFNKLLKILFGFRGTDTHGLKAFKREKILPIVNNCQTDGIIFDTEVVLRAQRCDISWKEIPVLCLEKRVTRLNIGKSIFQTFRDLFILCKILYWDDDIYDLS